MMLLAPLQQLLRRLEAGEPAPVAPVLARACADPAGVAPEELSQALVLAARCLELRARGLLPTPPAPEIPEEETDPALLDEPQQLAEKVAAFRVYQSAAGLLRAYESRWSRRFPRQPAKPGGDAPDVDLDTLLSVVRAVWKRARPDPRPIPRESVTLEGCLAFLRQSLSAAGEPLEFAALFREGASRLEVVVTFLALLELIRLREVRVQQEGPFAPLRMEWIRR